MVKIYLSTESRQHRQQRLQRQFNEYYHLIIKLLSHNRYGLTLQNIQMTVELSANTAKRVLALAAVENEGKYYLREVRR